MRCAHWIGFNAAPQIRQALLHELLLFRLEAVAWKRCGQKYRVSADSTGVPFCGKCGKPLPWLAETLAPDFQAVVEKSPIPVLIGFWAPWCGPCRIVAPAVERLSEELASKLTVVKLNTDQESGLGQGFGVQSIPTLLLMEGGKERDRVVGALNVNAPRSWVQARLPSPATKAQA